MTLLSIQDIERLTERKRPSDQVCALRSLGVRFRESLSGRPIVTTTALDEWIGTDRKPEQQKATINMDAVKSVAFRA